MSQLLPVESSILSNMLLHVHTQVSTTFNADTLTSAELATQLESMGNIYEVTVTDSPSGSATVYSITFIGR